MKRTTWLGIILVAGGLLTGLSGDCSAWPRHSPGERYVDCSMGESVQEVIDTRWTAPLEIHLSGICEEDLRISRGDLVINGDQEAEIVGSITVFGADVTIRDLTISGPGPGVAIRRGWTRLLRVTIVENEFDGVQAFENGMVKIADSVISSNGASGVFVQTAGLEIVDSSISDNNLDGILAEIGSRVMVRNTSNTGNTGVGVHVALHSVVDIRDGASVFGNDTGIGVLATLDSGIRITTNDVIFSDALVCDDSESSFVDNWSVVTGPIACTGFNAGGSGGTGGTGGAGGSGGG